MKHYVIIGNGVAAAACLEGIRSIDRKSSVTIVSEENHPVYCRPLISYYLEGKTDPEKMLYRSPDFYEQMNCTVLFGQGSGDTALYAERVRAVAAGNRKGYGFIPFNVDPGIDRFSF